MRGKDSLFGSYVLRGGITPAYAGKSGNLVSVRDLAQDHPRLCGEKACESIFRLLHPGSPPPMRGKGQKSSTGKVYGRITPAYAGKSNALKELYDDL